MVDEGVMSLWARYKEFRRQEDREQLIQMYEHLCERFRPKHASKTAWFSAEDFRQAGTIGLMEAVDRWDPSMNIPFEKYAAQRISGSMSDALRSNVDWASRRTREHLNKIATFRERFVREHGREPGLLEIADGLGVTLTLVAEVMAVAAGAEGGPLPMDDQVLSIVREQISDNDAWREALRHLPERQKAVLTLHYLESLAIEDVATALGLGSVTVHKAKKEALTSLKALLVA